MGGRGGGTGGDTRNWALGLVYIVAVAAIWIAASYLVQSVVDAGVSPFLLSYICNSLFLVYIPIVEVARRFDDLVGKLWFRSSSLNDITHHSGDPENAGLLQDQHGLISEYENENTPVIGSSDQDAWRILHVSGDGLAQSGARSDSGGRWTRSQVAKVSLLICPFWFFAQLTFNLSLKYTTVTSNTILSSTSSLFTFFVSVGFLGERFTWIKLISVLLCMGGTVAVGLADSGSGVNAIATNPVLGDFLALLSACLYAVYITLIRKKMPDERRGEGQASLLDNVLSDYLWAKAILLTTTTVATAGLSIQVPIAAFVDSLTGHAPDLLDYIGAAAVMVGFVGINIPSDTFCKSEVRLQEQEQEQEQDGATIVS